jgi:two-component system C4-dicarboxylate transport response regulator DctD
VRRALDRRSLVLENRDLRDRLTAGDGSMAGVLIGGSPAIEEARRLLATLARTAVDVLIEGETGAGKELAARCLHDFSQRREGPFVALNCGALPETVLESELFGHEAGAFTDAKRRRIGKVERAHGGTLFLDEIESMPLSVQGGDGPAALPPRASDRYPASVPAFPHLGGTAPGHSSARPFTGDPGSLGAPRLARQCP